MSGIKWLYTITTVLYSLTYFTPVVKSDEEIFVPKSSNRYCIIGAGPAGLQMGYFLQASGRDYVIFEQNDIPGSFFTRYPRHRKLISINKRYTGRSNREFNLRHDWNSLISDDEDLLFTKYSNDYFPHADDLLKYLNDFYQKFKLNVKFNTKIGQIRYHNHSVNELCRFTMLDQHENLICCKTLFVATGFQKTVRPNMTGESANLIADYSDISTNTSDYAGKNVLIIGRGNSGLETAVAIYGHTNSIHMLGRHRIRFSWDTHYVGDIRGVNNEIVDSYMLKSLDGFLESDVNDVELFRRDDKNNGKIFVRHLKLDNNRLTLPENHAGRDGYDVVISCMGFRWDESIFHESTGIKNSNHPNAIKKYPLSGFDYGSPTHPGLYFIGTLSHSLDYRKSAGGFIHGFRYTIRALHRTLEWRNHGVKWPAVSNSLDQLVTSLLKRANEASGIYQMFGHLSDVAIVDKRDKTFVYLEEVPVNLIPHILKYTGYPVDPGRHSVFVLTLQYGPDFSSINVDRFGAQRVAGSVDKAHESNFLHPVIYFYDGRVPTIQLMEQKSSSEVLPNPHGVHHILEDFTTNFDAPTLHRMPLRRFVEQALGVDLRSFTADSCIAMALMTSSDQLPIGCQRYLNVEESALLYM